MLLLYKYISILKLLYGELDTSIVVTHLHWKIMASAAHFSLTEHNLTNIKGEEKKCIQIF